MNDDYYGVVRDNKRVREGLPLLSPEDLILLKAKAFLALNYRRQAGDHVDEKHIKKHRNDVFKLSLLLAPDQQMTIPRAVHSDLQEFLGIFPENNSEWGYPPSVRIEPQADGSFTHSGSLNRRISASLIHKLPRR